MTDFASDIRLLESSLIVRAQVQLSLAVESAASVELLINKGKKIREYMTLNCPENQCSQIVLRLPLFRIDGS